MHERPHNSISSALLNAAVRELSSAPSAIATDGLGQFALAWFAFCEDQHLAARFLWPGGGSPKLGASAHIAASALQLRATVESLLSADRFESRVYFAAQAIHEWADLCHCCGLSPLECANAARQI
jgi:hypothetical protein